jgi:hypothetical protein
MPTSTSPSMPRKPTGSNSDGHHRGAGRRRRAVPPRQPLGGLRPRHPGLSEARRAAVRLGGRSSPAAWPQADGPAGQGRLLGQRVKLAQVGGYSDYPVFTRKVATDVSYLACAARLFGADVIYPAFATHNAYTIARSRRSRSPRSEADAFEFQRLHGMGEESTRRCASSRATAHAGAHLCAGRRAQGTARLSGAPPAGERGQHQLRQPHGRCRYSGRGAGRRSGGGAGRAEPAPQSGDPAARATSSARAATAPGSTCPTRWCAKPLLAKLQRCSRAQWRRRADLPGCHPRRNRPDHQRRTTAHVVGTGRDATAEEVDAAFTRAAAIQPGWDALGGEARALLLEEAADLFEAHTAEFLSLCQREAGKTLLDSVLELREAVDFLRYYAPKRGGSLRRTILPGPTGERTSSRSTGAGCLPASARGTSRWRSSSAWRRRAGGGQHRDRQARRADPADRRAGGQAVPRGGHPARSAPAAAGRGRGRRRCSPPIRASPASPSPDRPRPRAINRALANARRADRHADRRDRRAERDDRRQLGPARTGGARRVLASASRARASAVRRCGCSICRTTSPTPCWR